MVKAINSDLAAGAELLEGLLLKKAGPDDGPGLVESVYPGAGVAMLEREGRPGEVKNIDVVYTPRRRAARAARAARARSAPAARPGPALRDPAYSSAAARSLYSNPAYPKPGMDSRPRSPTIGTEAPAVYGQGGGVGEPARAR